MLLLELFFFFSTNTKLLFTHRTVFTNYFIPHVHRKQGIINNVCKLSYYHKTKQQAFERGTSFYIIHWFGFEKSFSNISKSIPYIFIILNDRKHVDFILQVHKIFIIM